MCPQVKVKMHSSLSGRKLYHNIRGSADTGAHGYVDCMYVTKSEIGLIEEAVFRKEKWSCVGFISLVILIQDV